jgi:hypothetical protein
VRDHPWAVALVAVAALWVIWRIWRSESAAREPRPALALVASAVVVLATLDLFGVVVVCVVVAAILSRPESWERHWIRSPAVVRAAAWAVVAGLFWLLYGLFVWKGADVGGLGGTALAKQVVKDMLYYPALHILAYLEAFPVMTAVVTAGTAVWALLPRERSERSEMLRLVQMWFWFPLFALGMAAEWVALRYTLSLYPFFLMIFAWTVCGVVAYVVRRLRPRRETAGRDRALATAGVVAFLLLVPVANEYHGVRGAWAAGRLTYGDTTPVALHGFPFHPDHKNPAEYVRRHLREDDVVVAMDVQQQQYYVGRVDYWLIGPDVARRFAYVRDGRRFCMYTGAVPLTNVEELRALVDGREGRRVWLTTSGELTGPLAGLVPPGLPELLDEWEDRVVFHGEDGATRVYLFD